MLYLTLFPTLKDTIVPPKTKELFIAFCLSRLKSVNVVRNWKRYEAVIFPWSVWSIIRIFGLKEIRKMVNFTLRHVIRKGCISMPRGEDKNLKFHFQIR